MKNELASNTQNKIPKRRLDAFFLTVGRSMADYLASLLCPDCGDKSDLDWVFEVYSDGKPQLVCRHCGRRFPIANLKFKAPVVDESEAAFVAELAGVQSIFALQDKTFVPSEKVVDV